MIGGEHKRERISERLQGLNNQPRCRGYLPGCHVRVPDERGASSYSLKTLQGNWPEERCDASYYSGHAVLPTELQQTWKTTYQRMVDDRLSSGNAKEAMERAEAQGANGSALRQPQLLDAVDGRHRCYPGHQPELNPRYVASTPQSTAHESYRNPQEVVRIQKQFIPLVNGRTPDAQPRAVILRLRHHMSLANVTFTALRDALYGCDTQRDGTLNTVELRAGLAAAGVPLSHSEVHVLLRYLDHHAVGTVTVPQFIQAVRGELSARRLALVKRAYNVIAKLLRGVVRLRDVLRLYDADSLREVREKYCSAEEARQHFHAQWGKTQMDDILELEDFIDCYTTISASDPDEHHFEHSIRNAWHLSGGDGPCKNTSCRRVRVVHTTGRITTEEIHDDLGISAEMVEEMRANLQSCGVSDIARIELLS